MRIHPENYRAVRKLLSDSFWRGARWFCFDVLSDKLDPHDLSCFYDYPTAAAFCKDQELRERKFRIKSISLVLKRLNGYPPEKVSATVIELLLRSFNRYPISFSGKDEDFVTYIRNGDFFPVHWNTLIDPLTHIEKFYILAIPKGDSLWKGHRLLAASEWIMDILLELRQAGKLMKTGKYEKILLYGTFAESGDITGIDFKDKTVGVSFYEIHQVGDVAGSSPSYKTAIINDITSPVLIDQVLFARFSTKTIRLDFYDGLLRKIWPGPITTHLDEEFFYFPAIVFE
ncbi:MAG: hypothetical protein P4L51_06055 [Puia sp.]|nr:hypothetical protein [Puia sp.]